MLDTLIQVEQPEREYYSIEIPIVYCTYGSSSLNGAAETVPAGHFLTTVNLPRRIPSIQQSSFLLDFRPARDSPLRTFPDFRFRFALGMGFAAGK
jgi:hypothetical protein